MINEMSTDTRKLADRLIEVPHGDTIDWDALSRAIGVKDARKVRWKVASAMRVALREAGAVFATLRGLGYRRVTIERLGDDVGRTARASIRHTARRANSRIGLGLAKANDVPNEARLAALREQSMLGLIEHLSQDRNVVEAHPRDQAPLPVATVLRQSLEMLGVT